MGRHDFNLCTDDEIRLRLMIAAKRRASKLWRIIRITEPELAVVSTIEELEEFLLRQMANRFGLSEVIEPSLMNSQEEQTC